MRDRLRTDLILVNERLAPISSITSTVKKRESSAKDTASHVRRSHRYTHRPINQFNSRARFDTIFRTRVPVGSPRSSSTPPWGPSIGSGQGEKPSGGRKKENNRAQLQYARGGDRVDNHSEMRSPACKMHRELGRSARDARGKYFIRTRAV